MSGHFRGWVEPKTRAELGIADDAASAWEQNGGGSGAADRKPSKGESAKEFARRMLLKNPNAFFYRHNKPNEDTWHGDWGEDEIENFVRVAKEHGCGDKWGLFASYVPHRVGVPVQRGVSSRDHPARAAAGRQLFADAERGDHLGREAIRRRRRGLTRRDATDATGRDGGGVPRRKIAEAKKRETRSVRDR